MSTKTDEPIQPNYLSEIDRTKREVEQDNFRKELITSVPEGEQDRGKIIEVLNATLRFDPNKTVQDVFAEFGKPIGRTTDFSNRGFFTDPRKIEQYGQERLQRVSKIMFDFTSNKLDPEQRKILGMKEK